MVPPLDVDGASETIGDRYAFRSAAHRLLGVDGRGLCTASAN